MPAHGSAGVHGQAGAGAVVTEEGQNGSDSSGSHLMHLDVRRKATASVFYIASAGALLLVVGFIGNLVLARLLTPADFGIVAFAMIVITLATTLADGGLAAGMVRRETPPTRGELRSLTGLQLLITTALAGISVAVALNFGESGRIAAVMILTLPLSSLQIAGRVGIIRNLEFWRTSATDFVATIAYYAWAIAAAAFGAGAWAMATGTVVRVVVTTGMIVALSPSGMVWPAAPQIRRLLPEIRFGVRFQLTGIIIAVRDQLINLATGAIGGVPMLGSFSLASRLMQAPGLLFQSMWQVGFPAIAHLLAGGRDLKPILEKATRVASVAAALLLAPFASGAPILVVPFFGSQWASVADLIPLLCLALLLIAPVSVGATGYLNAANRPGDLVRGMIYGTIVVLVVAGSLLPILGLVGLGIAFVMNSAVECFLFDRYVRRECGARLIRRAVAPTAIGIAAATAAIGFGSSLPSTILAAAATAAVALLLSLAGLAIVCLDDLRVTLELCRSSFRNALRRGDDEGGPGTLARPVEPLAETAPGLLVEP